MKTFYLNMICALVCMVSLIPAKAQETTTPAVVGDVAPSFTLKNMKGQPVTLADYKGKVIVLDFWATWCGPCKASFPGMQIAVNNLRTTLM